MNYKNKNKIPAGTIGIIVGYILFILLVDAISKPSNVSLALRPIGNIQTCFFSLILDWVILDGL